MTSFPTSRRLRQDLSKLFASFNRALDVLAIAGHGNNMDEVDLRTEGLASFIGATQAHIDDIERRVVVFGQLRTKLGEVQSRLIPLESEDGGVLSVIAELAGTRDRLAARMRRMEESDDGNLVERVKKFTEVKRELEERVAALSDQFVQAGYDPQGYRRSLREIEQRGDLRGELIGRSIRHA